MNDNNASFLDINIGDYVWWKIEDQDYVWTRPFDKESGARKAYYTSKLSDGTSIARFTMEGIGKVVNILNLNEEGFVSPASSLHKLKLNEYFADFETDTLCTNVYPKSINFPQNKFCPGVIFLVQCRNNCLIYLREQDVSAFNAVHFHTYKDDYMEQLRVFFADDTKPQPLYGINDIVSWYADDDMPAGLCHHDKGSYYFNTEKIITFDSCDGLIVDMVWYENPYSFTYIECADYLTYNYNSEEIPMNPVQYIHEDYTGWVYGVMSSIHGNSFVLWTPEENIYMLDFDEIYTPLIHDEDNNPIYINKEDLMDDEFTFGCVDFIVPWFSEIDEDEDEEVSGEDYSDLPFDSPVSGGAGSVNFDKGSELDQNNYAPDNRGFKEILADLEKLKQEGEI